MPRALRCPNCGSPLPYDAGAGANVVACYYCEHPILFPGGVEAEDEDVDAEPEGAAQQRADAELEAFAERSFEEPLAAQASRRLDRRHVEASPSRAARKIAIVVAGPLAVAGLWLATSSRAAAEEPLSEELLRRVELASTAQEIGVLLDVSFNASAVTRDFRRGIVRRAELQWSAGDKTHASKVTLFLRPGALEPSVVRTRLRELSPNRVQPFGVGSHRLYVGDSVLDLSKDTLVVWHWTSVHPAGGDLAACNARRAAFWTAARFAALDGRALTPEELALVSGPPLAAATRLSTTLTVEQVTEELEKTFPAGRCVSQAGMTCSVDVDHPLVHEVRWRWPNAVKGRLRDATLTFRRPADPAKTQRVIAACLEGPLGRGEEAVVDYVTGARNWTWSVGSAGDRVTLTARDLRFSVPAGAKPDNPAAWPARFDAVIEAVARCGL